MGSCLCKFKRNKISHSAMEDELRKRTTKMPRTHKAPDPIRPADMVKQLEDVEAEETRVGRGGIAFTVDLKEGDPSRMPSRLADRLDGVLTPPDSHREVQYTSEEREILAELMRNDILNEKSEKARRDVHLFDAARRRAARNPE